MAGTTNNKKASSLVAISMLLALGGMIFTYVQWDKIDLTEKGGWLFWIGAIVGIAIGYALLRLIKKNIPGVSWEQSNALGLGLIAAGLFNFGSLAVWSNLAFPKQTQACTVHEVVKRETRSEKSGRRFIEANYVILKMDKESEQAFRVDEDMYAKVPAFKTFEICKRDGLFGFNFVDGVKPKDAKAQIE